MKRTAFVLLFAACLLLTSCGSIDIAAQWRAGDIAIDAKTDDWQGGLYILKDAPVSFGVRNDDRFVYFCLEIADPTMIAPIVRQGLTVKFSPAGGKGVVLGLKYPLGMTRGDSPRAPQGPPLQPDEERVPRLDRDEVEVTGPGGEGLVRLKKDQVKGIEIALDSRGGLFIYELKVPLLQGPDAPFAVQCAPGKILGIEIQTAELDLQMPDRDTERAPGGGYGGGGGRGGMGGGMGGRGGRGGGGRGMRANEPIKIKLNATLALKPAQ